MKLLPSARERLVEIWEYTFRRWGDRQADSYVSELVVSIETLAARRHSWRAIPESRFEGIYVSRHRHHYIFFRRLTDDEIGVLTILHENMDLPNRLHDELGRSD